MSTLELPSWLESGEATLIGQEEEVQNDLPDLTSMPPDIEEQTIVKDLLYCLIGAEGSYIRLVDNQKYEIRCKIHDSISSFVEKIIPICNDFCIIRKYAEGHFAFHHGRIMHALCSALRTVTSEYQQTIAKFENARRLTPSLLLGNLQNPAEMLHALSTLILALTDKRGVPILSEIQKRLASFRGSPKIRQLFTYLFQTASVPLLDFIQKWIYMGIVDDPFDEFFITEDSNITADVLGSEYESNFWSSKYELNTSRLPHFISAAALKSILSAGKCISVLTICGLQMPNPPKLNLEALQRETIIDSAFLSASLRLVSVLREKYDLLKYAKMFRSVFLCGRGDWVAKFNHLAAQTMSVSRDKAHIPAIDANFAASLPSDYSKYFSAFLEQDTLSTQVQTFHSVSRENPQGVAPSSAKVIFGLDYSWDYFDIKPDVRWPISLVFNHIVVTKYQLLFRTLFTWKHLESLLGECWRISSRTMAVLPEVDGMRHAVHHFCSSFLGYAAIDVIHPLWASLLDQMETSSSIDALFKAHDEALDEALNGLFISSKETMHKLITIAQNSFNFVSQYKKYAISVSKAAVTDNQKRSLISPVKNCYDKFHSNVASIVQELAAKSTITGNTLFSDFVRLVNVNHDYIVDDVAY
ncbi:Spc97 / Spc98 family protein [Trichomonas vaginalis G3]|uniref:Spc97 / Spc98 family protein n=1 Tax=Trichomonas vaginalis (strain ATCC PRA-98 / G3) TaxID=412133 RepID=A2E1L0_TRIV3|nr:microtubule nucleation by interphase microtubule organizing center [Trichomonas vaginalis G3]EAY13457.1 Spc97 / Spc98 family protein [Trichomonas vaginalis G3]KAI5518348.1 microtubule nucleation by interphase microtubule organizing center [Trichomonas vaginalis G3]|eukprot:XP_001325680.1 Spc97 / Spc98 family protein [Trichomonas vaginalis G3]